MNLEENAAFHRDIHARAAAREQQLIALHSPPAPAYDLSHSLSAVLIDCDELAKLRERHNKYEEALRDIVQEDCGCPANVPHGCGNDHPVVQGLREIAREALKQS